MKDPHRQFRKAILISLLILSVGIGQLIVVIAGRSWLIWTYDGNSGIEGDDVVNIPQSYLLPDRYLVIIIGKFPYYSMPDVVGNITLTPINGGDPYFFEYRINGYWIGDNVKTDARSVVIIPGIYNITWSNVDNRFAYLITTHGLFNWFFAEDTYPYTAETVVLVISIILTVFFIGYSIKKYQEAKRDLAYYK
ncbi:MAG: hypothetical protein JSV62_04415 [Promethearchaeota archaeon]|nr:MAG: hypothetical protein JSV62_04415 [Candidatus Lokiarchaeota archaeon]